ncbi:hypothetical protein TNCV_3223911 [Trichonephila clavipes]|nr:hypothetical protein TNCV_3223911 [Trichonephila clavipes]
MFEKVSVLLYCSTVSWEEFIAVDDNNVCTAPILWQRYFGDCTNLKNTIGGEDSVDENEMNITAPVSTSSEMRNVMKSLRRYIDAHSK